ncbi:MAG: hypothetical protein OJF61_003037 [Rhodanobacteraceae bacterium]|nr:MAG: hypothetical protein OJF61_003037 [Rhodanobacteraceae bacterium]
MPRLSQEAERPLQGNGRSGLWKNGLRGWNREIPHSHGPLMMYLGTRGRFCRGRHPKSVLQGDGSGKAFY